MRQRYGALFLTIRAAAVILNLVCQTVIVLIVAVEFSVAKIVLRTANRIKTIH